MGPLQRESFRTFSGSVGVGAGMALSWWLKQTKALKC